MKRLSLWILVALAVSLLAWAALRERAVPVKTAAVTVGPLVVTLDEEGTTRVRERHVVRAPLDGMLHRISLQPGDAVAAETTGVATVEPLAPGLLDARSIAIAEARVGAMEASLGRAEDEARSAQSLLDSARAELQRQSAASSSVSVQAIANAEREVLYRQSELAAASANVRVALHGLKEARAALLHAQPEPTPADGEAPPTSAGQLLTVRAPISGKVLRVLRESAGPVRIGDPLLEVGDTAQLEIVADYLTTEAVRIEPGMRAIIDDWGGATPLGGRVRRVEPAATTKVSSLGIEEQRVDVILDLLQESSNLSALGDGFRVEARVVIWQSDAALLVPEAALFKGDEGWFVFHVEDGMASRAAVEIGYRDGRSAEVLGGLSEGQEVVLYPSDELHDGVRVNLDDQSR